MHRIRRAVVCILFMSILLTGAGCAAGEVTFEQLFAKPDSYNGKTITLEGFYFHGFEAMLFCEELKLSGYAEGHLVPAGEMMWVEGSLPPEIFDGLEQQSMMGPTERYGRLRIEGMFEHGGQYGHLDGPSSQITIAEAELLPWIPPQPSTS